MSTSAEACMHYSSQLLAAMAASIEDGSSIASIAVNVVDAQVQHIVHHMLTPKNKMKSWSAAGRLAAALKSDAVIWVSDAWTLVGGMEVLEQKPAESDSRGEAMLLELFNFSEGVMAMAAVPYSRQPDGKIQFQDLTWAPILSQKVEVVFTAYVHAMPAPPSIDVAMHETRQLGHEFVDAKLNPFIEPA